MDNQPQSDTVADERDPDQERSPKRARLDAPLTVTEDTQHELMDEDDWDDIYGDLTSAPVTASDQQQSSNAPSTVPEQPGPTATAPSAPHEHQYGIITSTKQDKPEIMDGVPPEAIAGNDELVAPPPRPSPENNDMASVHVMEATTEVEYHPPEEKESSVKLDEGTTKPDEAMADADSHPQSHQPRVTEDPEFMAAAAAQKGNSNSEWQFDSSDAESSSDSNSSDSSDDSSDESDGGSEDGYEMLDPATAARILMSGDGDDDEGDKSKGKTGNHQPRTANEVKQEAIVKPNITITSEMGITLLGNVESIVENMILIKGATPGEYQVLEGESVLCNEKREVIGAVADTFGRVQEPLYSVAFNSSEEIEQAGLAHGTQVYYVNEHSTFVFTQPLKNVKGTDASNIHDEEVGEDELEFSDDEVEAEYKKQKKQAKKAGRGGLSRSAFQSGTRTFGAAGHDGGETFTNGSDAPALTYGAGMTYDDNEPAEDFYQPLKRPENLSQLMAGGAPLPLPPQPSFDRGRGRGRGERGRGRGRGDRGRGRGGFDNRNQRGGRGGFGSQNYNHRGNADSFPDRHNSQSSGHSLPPKPSVPPPYVGRPGPGPGPGPGPAPAPAPVPAPTAQYPSQQGPQTYQFNGYTFQYGNPPPQPQQAPAQQYNYYNQQQIQPQQNAVAPMLPGAYVNPAFYQQPQQQSNPVWNGQYQTGQPQPGTAPHHSQPLPQQPHQQPHQQQQTSPTTPMNFDLTSILKRLRPS